MAMNVTVEVEIENTTCRSRPGYARLRMEA